MQGNVEWNGALSGCINMYVESCGLRAHRVAVRRSTIDASHIHKCPIAQHRDQILVCSGAPLPRGVSALLCSAHQVLSTGPFGFCIGGAWFPFQYSCTPASWYQD
jgi:hypothetical protein